MKADRNCQTCGGTGQVKRAPVVTPDCTYDTFDLCECMKRPPHPAQEIRRAKAEAQMDAQRRASGEKE